MKADFRITVPTIAPEITVTLTKGVSPGVVGGISAGIVGFFLIILGLIAFLFFTRRRKVREPDGDEPWPKECDSNANNAKDNELNADNGPNGAASSVEEVAEPGI